MTQKSENIRWHGSELSSSEREKHLGVGAVVWFTGLSGSGKSTVARAVEAALVRQGHSAYVLDGDNLRFGLNTDLGFSAADRRENIRRVGEVAKLFAGANVILLAAFISPYQKDRDAIRSSLLPNRFVEVHVGSGGLKHSVNCWTSVSCRVGSQVDFTCSNGLWGADDESVANW